MIRGVEVAGGRLGGRLVIVVGNREKRVSGEMVGKEMREKGRGPDRRGREPPPPPFFLQGGTCREGTVNEGQGGKGRRRRRGPGT